MIHGKYSSYTHGCRCTECKEANNIYVRKYREVHPYSAKDRLYHRRHMRKVRKEVLLNYGHACACCGETVADFLCVDHIDNSGAAHRKEIGRNIDKWLKRHNFPKDNFQLLCWNCNNAKKLHGHCPYHKKQIAVDFTLSG